MDFPKDLKYTKNDEWIRIEADQGTIGITDYAQDQLSDIVFVETTLAAGETAGKGAACATIESVKAAAEVYLPLGGTVSAVNEDLPQTPEQINSDPYGAAWILRIQIADPSEAGELLDASAYEAYCKERSG
ncbi:MAG TPA: glycine cleavage system protein GcvH [Anaerolineales bacterium]|nr:glycine cleavage system protein GcvH [Anaerolineales bacterium]